MTDELKLVLFQNFSDLIIEILQRDDLEKNQKVERLNAAFDTFKIVNTTMKFL